MKYRCCADKCNSKAKNLITWHITSIQGELRCNTHTPSLTYNESWTIVPATEENIIEYILAGKKIYELDKAKWPS